MLKQRLFTALLLIPLALWGTLALPKLWFALVLAGLVGLAAWEWAGFAHLESAQRAGYVLLVVGLALAAGGAMAVLPQVRDVLLILGLTWWLLALRWVARFPQTRPWMESRAGCLLAGVVVLVLAWTAFVGLRASAAHGPEFVVFLLVLVWVADSAAFFAGKRWGSRRLAPAVSPGKTWEGVFGALAATGVLAVVASALWGLSWGGILAFVVLCEVTVAFSIVGDLLESLFKRMAGLKDSGGLLPGHGGVLDRVDSLTSAAPIFLLGLLLLRIPA